MTSAPRTGLRDLEALALLEDATRRKLYEFVAGRRDGASREECARALGIDRSLAAYHLDRLLEAGLLSAAYVRPPGRGGPGAGRPPKVYRRAEGEFVARAPARDYRLLAELLVGVAAGAGPQLRQRVERAARRLGESLGEGARAAGTPRLTLQELLRGRGYEPYATEAGVLRLRNCPFDAVAAAHPELVCRLNLALLDGVLRGLGEEDARAVLSPQPGLCCVAIQTRSSPCEQGRARTR